MNDVATGFGHAVWLREGVGRMGERLWWREMRLNIEELREQGRDD